MLRGRAARDWVRLDSPARSAAEKRASRAALAPEVGAGVFVSGVTGEVGEIVKVEKVGEVDEVGELVFEGVSSA